LLTSYFYSKKCDRSPLAVITPVTINTPTAVKDLLENQGNPHIPCPDVHPVPRAVPTPTKSPANKYPIWLNGGFSVALSNT